MKTTPALAALALLSAPAAAQTPTSPSVTPEAPLQVAMVQATPAVFLPANTEVLLSMNQEVTTKGDRWKEGDNFDMSVANDVTYSNYVIIPKGSRGVGRISFLTSKGAFGKSGKMDIELEYVEVAGRRIPVAGHYRQEGEGNTVATVGGVILAGVFAGFVTGKSGRIPQGRELMARTKSDLPLALPAGASPPAVAPMPVQPVAVPAAMPVAASAVVTSTPPAPVMVSTPVVQAAPKTTEAK